MNNGLSLVPTMSGDHQVWVHTLSEYTPHSLQLTTLTFNLRRAYDWQARHDRAVTLSTVCVWRVYLLICGLMELVQHLKSTCQSGELTDLNECSVTNLNRQNIESHQQKIMMTFSEENVSGAQISPTILWCCYGISMQLLCGSNHCSNNLATAQKTLAIP